MRIPESLIEEIRSKSDIVDTISRYVSLNKKGKNYWGVCPFHEDTNPSMSVSPDRQIYKCFVCGAGGNVFNFIQKFEKINFVESVLKQGSFVGVDTASYEAQLKPEVSDARKPLYDAMKDVQEFTELQLFTQSGRDALKIVEGRGYDTQLIKRFGIGVAFDNNQILTYLRAKGYDDKTLLEADLIRLTDDGYRDVFYNRIMFPIFDRNGRVVAFSARSLDPNSSVKYINTSETVLYTKGFHLYNFQFAREASRREGYVIVCEGVTDAIAFSKIGAENVVSLLGVACTEQQVTLLQQCHRNVVLAFDGDRAGVNATFNIGQKLRQSGCDVSVWYNDSGMDPDDAVRKIGADIVRQGLDERLSWMDFLMSYGYGLYGGQSFEDKKRFVSFMLTHLQLEDNLTRNYYLKKVSDRTSFDINVLKQQLEDKSQEIRSKNTPVLVEKATNKAIAMPDRIVLKYMMTSKEYAYIFRDELGFLISDLATSASLVILDVYRRKNYVEIADVLSMDIRSDIKALLFEIDTQEILGVINKEDLLFNIGLIQSQALKQGMHYKRQELFEKEDIMDQALVLDEIINALRNK